MQLCAMISHKRSKIPIAIDVFVMKRFILFNDYDEYETLPRPVVNDWFSMGKFESCKQKNRSKVRTVFIWTAIYNAVMVSF
jgi:hypothetical protein